MFVRSVSLCHNSEIVIYIILGENTYAAEQELQRLAAGVATVERYEGSELDEAKLSDILRGMSLFASERTVIITRLSEQKMLWEKLALWIDDVAPEVTVILRESSIDKRLKSTKDVLKQTKLIAAEQWTDRDTRAAEEWLGKLMKDRGLAPTRAQLADMIQRAHAPAARPGSMVIDQMQLAQAVAALAVLDEVSDESIAAVLPPARGEVLFRLLDKAIDRDDAGVQTMLAQLHANEDPYLAFAGVVKQWLQLVALKLAGGASGDLAIHPYVLGRLQSQAKHVSQVDARAITQLAADLDARMKISEVTPWEGFDRFVMAIVLR